MKNNLVTTYDNLPPLTSSGADNKHIDGFIIVHKTINTNYFFVVVKM